MSLPTTQEELQRMIDEAVAKSVGEALRKAEDDKQAAVAEARRDAARNAVNTYRYILFNGERKRIAKCTTPCRYTKGFYLSQKHFG